MTPFRMTKPSARIASAAASRCAGSILPLSFSVEEISSTIISPCHERLLLCRERGHRRGPGRRRPVVQQLGCSRSNRPPSLLVLFAQRLDEREAVFLLS